MVWAVSLFLVTWLQSWPDASPWRCQQAQAEEPIGRRQLRVPLTQQGRGCPSGWARGCGLRAELLVPAVHSPLPAAHRCTCSSGRTWMSSCSAWASCLSVCSSPPAWPRWVLPLPTAAGLPRHPLHDITPLACTCGHCWPPVPCLPAGSVDVRQRCLLLQGTGQGS